MATYLYVLLISESPQHHTWLGEGTQLIFVKERGRKETGDGRRKMKQVDLTEFVDRLCR